ncbi:glucose 1-dehydrogenase [Iodidimonas sp. SYSU 1G8]|uniref:SDR family NAD(P)-dependent oxidoreductase n=1 Tax=Iodidimonas sp. SYSU 1G8 TaxID=3133967 RepID=UPI0031FF14CF
MGMHERFRLDGKVAVVTGGGRGIGKGIALAFAECGADVVVVARRQADVDEVASEIQQRGQRGLGISADVLDWDAIPAVLDRVVKEFGHLDIMVNNAGGNLDRKTYPLPEIPIEKWDEQIALNMKTKFWGAQQAAKRMTNGGRIINIISVAAHNASLGFGAYSSANNGMIAFTRTMAVELAPKKITVNCIAPGIIVTDMFKETLNMTEEQALKMAADATPLGRTGYPEDVAAAAVFFASPAAEWTTGQFLDVAGGR